MQPADAFIQVVESCRPRIYRAACLLLDNPHDAEDVTQTVFLEAWHGWAGFEGRSEPFTWLYTILRRACARRRRRAFLRFWERTETGEPDHVPSVGPGPYESAAAAEERAAVRALLRRLSPKLRDVLVLRYIEDYPVAACAAALNVPEGTVKSRINYALREAARQWNKETPP